MARWRTDAEGLRRLEGWASREELCRCAAALGHQLDLFYPLVDAGPYKREAGQCRHCGLVALWGLLYRGKDAQTIEDSCGAHRARRRATPTIEEEENDGDDPSCLKHPLNAWQRMYRGKHRKPVGFMSGQAVEQRCRRP